MKIATISPYTRFAEQLKSIAAKFPEIEVDFFQADFKVDGYVEKAIDYVSEIEREGYDAIIARGIAYRAISPKMNTPVIYAGETLYDTIKALHKVEKGKNGRRRVYHFALEGSLTPDVDFIKILNDIFDIELMIVTYASFEECKEILNHTVENGSVVVGGQYVVMLCKEYGIEHVRSESSYNTLYEAFVEAIKIAKIRRHEVLEKNKIKSILDFAHEGIAYINIDMKIEMVNPMAKKILGLSEYSEQEGQELEFGQLRNLCLTAVETGKVYTEEILTACNNAKLMCNILPVIIRGEVKGLTVTFRETAEVIQMEKKIRKELAKKAPGAKYYVEDIIGTSTHIQACKKLVKQFGKFDSNVLIYGHTGTGKELFAQSIHNESNRENELFFAINCAALPEQLLESELFGYTEGAFTGAKKGGKQGLFELAHGGTLYLDEITEMSMSSQSKLLRVLQEGEIRRIGDDKVQPVDVRIIASSQKNLYAQIRDNLFREDLFYRLNVMSLTIPPLNSRSEDIPHLIRYFLALYNEKFQADRRIQFDPDAIEFLMNYKWSGNVRQLQNFIERVYVYDLADNVGVQQVKELLREFDMLAYVEDKNFVNRGISERANEGNLRNATSEIVKEALDMFNGNQTKAASWLGVSRTYIWRKLKELENEK
ncbi:MAG: sigma 54-interacting transcriptional regulator [Clostridiales bacterium]|nr:sigma 54-interacting transcriptional regulator [Clostridiales bacterium]